MSRFNSILKYTCQDTFLYTYHFIIYWDYLMYICDLSRLISEVTKKIKWNNETKGNKALFELYIQCIFESFIYRFTH